MVVETRYVTSGEVFVAYQISGQDGPDLLMTPGFVSHLELSWENPNAARFLNDLGSFSRLIRFDKRGTGLSDRGVGIPHLDERIDDIRAVLDAAGSKRAYLFGVSEGGPMSILFAAIYPERVAGLILFGTYARTVGASVPFDDIAARVAQRAKASEVLASSTVRDLVAGAGLKFVDQGPAELKGLAEPMRLFAAVT